MSCTIPERFSLMNRDYTVRRGSKAEEDVAVQMAENDGGRLMGLCDFDEAEVILMQHNNRESFEHTYFHELAHALMEAIGQPDLAKDEALVDTLGAALHQYEKTKAGRLTLRERKDGKETSTAGRHSKRLQDIAHRRAMGRNPEA